MIPMAFGPEHWKTPRASIATVYRDNDLGYATHGAHICADILLAFNIAPVQAKRSKILDFGCGTGRVTRILSRHFGYVVGFDPEQACIDTGVVEAKHCKPIGFTNMVLNSNWERVEALGPFNHVCAVSVFEHLDLGSQELAFNRIRSVLEPAGDEKAPGVAVLWLHSTKNAQLIASKPFKRIAGPDAVSAPNAIGLYTITADAGGNP